MKKTGRLWLGLGILVVLSPLGLLLPQHFKSSGAWGEWGPQELKSLAGYIPRGLEKIFHLWSAPFAGYTVGGGRSGAAYFLSAGIGVLACVGIVFLLGKFLNKK